MTAEEFKRRWESTADDRLNAFPENSLSDVRVPRGARAFLIEAGLPDSAAPFLPFDPPKKGTLPRFRLCGTSHPHLAATES